MMKLSTPLLLTLTALLTFTACSTQNDQPDPDPIEEPAPDPAPEEKPNLIENGTFDSDEAWDHFFFEPAVGEAAIREGEFCFDVTNGGDQVWQVQLVQSELGVEQGKTYTLRFDAYADQPVQMRGVIEEDGGNFALLAGQTFDLTETKSSYEVTALIEEAVEKNRINLSTGGELVSTVPVTLCVDNVVVQEAATASE